MEGVGVMPSNRVKKKKNSLLFKVVKNATFSYEIKTELQITLSLLTRHEKIKDRSYSLLSVF